MNRNVFFFSSAIIILITILGASAATEVGSFIGQIQEGVSNSFGWLYLVGMTSFLIFMTGIAMSRFGTIRLGEDNSQPEFKTLSWLAMLFSAGMGIGLLFYGVAEPIMHFNRPAPFVDHFAAADAHRYAMALTFFHWGLHPWACYALVGLGLAFFAYRKHMPLSMRSVFYPIFKDKIKGVTGDIIDIVAIVSTLFGVATSLGFGASQVNAGLSYLFGIPQNQLIQALIIITITGFATISVVSGLKKGIKLLSQGNMLLAFGLLCIVLILGPTVYIINSLVDNIGAYLSEFSRLSFRLYTQNEEAKSWQTGWTLMYWAWWIAWSPFVGMFIARISKGRTIRQFILGVMAIPTLMSFVWFTVFGSSALKFEIEQPGSLSKVIDQSIVEALFVFLENYAFSAGLSLIAVVSIILFFVTSSDSASLVIDTIASGGKKNPPVAQKVYWACLEGFVAAVLLYFGGLKALQTASLLVALPLCILLIMSMYGLLKAFRTELPKKPGHG
ncbi:BCCT family transporter [bacterium]|nr:BCCT family transporter [bacterium]